MKKAIILCMLIIGMMADAQNQIITKPLQLSTVNQGLVSDSILVWGKDKVVKFIPKSSFGGGSSQNLQNILNNGNSATVPLIISNVFTESKISDNEISVRNLTNGNKIYLKSGAISFYNSSRGNCIQLSPSDSQTLYSQTFITLPNQNGQLALKSDLGIAKISEGNGFGIIRADRNPAYFGNIGSDAVDLSNSYGESETVGATGMRSTIGGGYNNTNNNSHGVISGGHNNIMSSGHDSFIGGGDANSTSGSDFAVIAGGYRNQAGSKGSVLGGEDNRALGAGSGIIGGYGNRAIGDYSFASGGYNTAYSMGETVLGIYATDYTAINSFSYSETDRIFNIGNGKWSSTTPFRSDAFTILKNGLATLPSVTNALIDAESTGKAVPTKEWVQKNKKINGVLTYSDNTTALAAGLKAGDLYRTSTGILMITY